MTRTNRSMTEPPLLTPEAQACEDTRAAFDAGPAELRSMAMLTACVIAAGALAVMIAIGWGVHHQITGQIARLQADLRALQTFASCDAPKRPGDVTVITYRRNDHQVATRCQVITNPTEPERAFQ